MGFRWPKDSFKYPKDIFKRSKGSFARSKESFKQLKRPFQRLKMDSLHRVGSFIPLKLLAASGILPRGVLGVFLGRWPDKSPGLVFQCIAELLHVKHRRIQPIAQISDCTLGALKRGI